ncbi:MAG: methyl-accepting chemotaxis protein [Pirellulales bacterium]
MKTLSLNTKVALIVAVLAATVLVVAVVGARQLGRVTARTQILVEELGQTAALNSALQIAFLYTIRMEKNAVLVNDEARSSEFAREAEAGARKVDSMLTALTAKVAESGDLEQRQALEEFRQQWQTYRQSLAEVLRLAQLNTNSQARTLVESAVEPDLQEFVEFFSRVGRRLSQASSSGSANDARAALTALEAAVNVKDIASLLYRHNSSAADPAMNLLDQRLREVLDQLDDDLRTLKPALDPLELAEATRLASEARKLGTQVAAVQKLSRANSNLAAAERTVVFNYKVGTEANNALTALAARLEQQMRVENQASQADHFWGIVELAAAGLLGTLVGGAVALLISRSIVADIHELAKQIGAAASDLTQVSHVLSAQSEEMSIQASNVAGGAEQMTGNISTIAAAAEEMSMNVASISSASEQISVNVSRISAAAQSTATNVQTVAHAVQAATVSFQSVADDAKQSALVTAQASTFAQQASGKMQALDRAAHEISKVTEMIKLIAMQTNLLALNATIEATSAGEAGKGFAVVADEIKELAGQSGKAAQDIAHMIEGIQLSTRDSVGAIGQVAETISAISTASERISAAVVQQSMVAQQIAGNLDAASKGVGHIAQSIAEVAQGANDMSRNASDASLAAGDVAHNSSESARAVRDIASNIQGVSGSTKEAAEGAQRVSLAAQEMERVSLRLDRLVRST